MAEAVIPVTKNWLKLIGHRQYPGIDREIVHVTPFAKPNFMSPIALTIHPVPSLPGVNVAESEGLTAYGLTASVPAARNAARFARNVQNPAHGKFWG